MYKILLKPTIDLGLALLLLVALSPLMLLIVILLALSDGGGVWFIQERPGKDEKLFKLIKFRSMNNRRDEDGALLPDELRLTGIGKWVRKLSLDELPQIINVLKGEMSFVGPRPLLVEYLPLYNQDQHRRHSVRPGITGWAQVNGRNTMEWVKRFEYDLWYIDNISFMLDMKILLLTIVKVFKKEGISSGTSATMEKFRGNA